jgi:hypothetical protein
MHDGHLQLQGCTLATEDFPLLREAFIFCSFANSELAVASSESKSRTCWKAVIALPRVIGLRNLKALSKRYLGLTLK